MKRVCREGNNLNEENNGHAELGASSAHRWIACPASVKASRGLPDSSSPAAAEGTAAHELAEQSLVMGFEPHEFIGATFNGILVSEEMADHIKIYTDFCRSLSSTQALIEQRLDYSPWAKGGFGTADYISISEGEAYVVDLKFGRRLVNADCDQLKCYALGVINELGFDAQLDTIHMVISQPRMGHHSTHTMRVKDLLKWGRTVLLPASKATRSEDPAFNPSESACHFCKAAPTCKPLAEHALALTMLSFDDLTVAPPQAKTMSPVDVARLMPHLGLIKSWCDGVAGQAHRLAASGIPIEGYKLVQSKTNRRWSDEQQALEIMQKITNEPVYKAKTLSPTQAIKLLGVENKELMQLITKPEGKPTLVVETDNRPAIDVLAEFDVIEK